MKEKIHYLLTLISTGYYDKELAHIEYDRILENYITNINDYGQDEYLLICELIKAEKHFWYA